MGQMLVLESTALASMAVLRPEEAGTATPLMSLPSMVVFFYTHRSKEVKISLAVASGA